MNRKGVKRNYLILRVWGHTGAEEGGERFQND